MARIIEITYSEGKTWQEVQFEPRTFHFSAKMEVDSDKESIEVAYDLLKEKVRKQLDKALHKGTGEIKKEDVPF